MQIPQTLRQSLRSGQVIPFVGAGVSMAVQRIGTGEPLFPSWKQLLEHAAARLHVEGKPKEGAVIQALLESDHTDFSYAAKRAREGLGPVWFQFLKDEIDAERPNVEEASLALAQSVWSLGSKLVITTNYDRVLEWASPEETSSWIIQATAEQAHLLQGRLNRWTVWHLHGFIDDVASLILSPNGYDQLYPNNQETEIRYAAALETLRAQIASKTLLFIGFSLEDERFVNELRRNDEIFGGAGGPHYVLVAESGMERFRSLKLSVQPLAFAGYGQPLLDALHALADVTVPTSDFVATPIATERSVAESRDFSPNRPVFSVPFRPKGDQVIGRNAALEAVREQLVSGRRTAIGQTAAFQGLGGLGKTQLAVEYAYRYAGEYPNGVIWLNADQDLSSQLIELADRAAWVAPESEAKHKLEVAAKRIGNYSNCLIIFDNLEDIETIEFLLPLPHAHPHILVTSRSDQPGFARIPLDPLTDELALDLLLQEAGKRPTNDSEWQEAREIAGALGGLPLALELAGAFLQHRDVTWNRYNALLRINLKAALPGGRLLRGSFTKHEADLYSTLKIQEEIYRDEPRLKDILDLLTWSGPAPMSESLLTTLLDVAKPEELSNALGLGVALRLLQRNPNSASYSIHRLVGEVRREDVPLTARLEWARVVCKRLAQWFEGKREEFSNLIIFEAEIDHLTAWRGNASLLGPDLEVRLIWLQAYPPFHLGEYRRAKDWIDAALELYSKTNQTDLELKAHLLHDLALLITALGDPSHALATALQALQIRLEIFGEQHAGTAKTIELVGGIYSTMENTAQAEEYGLRALEIRKALFGEGHPDTARAFANMGIHYSMLGHHHRAVEFLRKGLDIHERILGKAHPDTAASQRNMGIALSKFGQKELGLQYVNEALAALQSIFGDAHPDVAITIEHLAKIQATTNIAEALVSWRKCLAIRQEILGPFHRDTIRAAYHVAFYLFETGDKEEALEISQEFLSYISKGHPSWQHFKHLLSVLSAKAIRPGFRQPSENERKMKPKRRGKKKR